MFCVCTDREEYIDKVCDFVSSKQMPEDRLTLLVTDASGLHKATYQ